MAGLSWQDAIDIIHPYVVKISTPLGFGTGFLFAHSADNSIVAVASAAHVLSHAHEWQQPIRLYHPSSKKDVFLKEEDRAIVLDSDLDTAAVVFTKPPFPLPDSLLALAPQGKRLRQGVNLGWVGFPGFAAHELCFFTGHISAYLESREIYLVDGVVINGVSGGPAFIAEKAGGITLAGVITAYIPNRANGEPLPGLCMVSDVSQLQIVVETFKSLDEAKEQETPPAPGSNPPVDPAPGA